MYADPDAHIKLKNDMVAFYDMVLKQKDGENRPGDSVTENNYIFKGRSVICDRQ